MNEVPNRSRSEGRDDPALSTSELMQALAQVAQLTLTSERLAALADGFGTVIADQVTLRAALSRELEPHMVFDPRWD